MKSSEKTAFEIILVIAVVLAIVTLPLISKAAEQGKQHSPPSFSQFDTDEDGFVSSEEFNSYRAKRMAAMAEAGKPMKGAETAPTFADIDTNGDGKLTEEELTIAQQAHHASMRAEH